MRESALSHNPHLFALVTLALVMAGLINGCIYLEDAKYDNAPEWQKTQWEQNREDDYRKYGPDPSYGGTTHLN